MFVRGFEKLHPRVQFIYYLLMACITMFCRNPLVVFLSFLGSAALAADCGRQKRPQGLGIWMAVIFAGAGLLNFLFVHRGDTVLFFLGNNPMTLESLIYGLDSGLMAVAVLLWSFCFSRYLSGDRLLCVFGGISPKLALAVSMIMRFIPMYRRRLWEIRRAQKAIGLYKEDSLPDRIRSEGRILAVLLTGALENGIVTADSMEARGYGKCRRSFYTPLCMRREDWIFGAVSTLALGGVGLGIIGGDFASVWYPTFRAGALSLRESAATAVLAAVALAPSILQWSSRLFLGKRRKRI